MVITKKTLSVFIELFNKHTKILNEPLISFLGEGAYSPNEIIDMFEKNPDFKMNQPMIGALSSISKEWEYFYFGSNNSCPYIVIRDFKNKGKGFTDLEEAMKYLVKELKNIC